MTAARLRECLDRLGWSTAELAASADVSPVTARRRIARIQRQTKIRSVAVVPSYSGLLKCIDDSLQQEQQQ
jgi:hypothetical protein